MSGTATRTMSCQAIIAYLTRRSTSAADLRAHNNKNTRATANSMGALDRAVLYAVCQRILKTRSEL
jgi:hypothetical protein